MGYAVSLAESPAAERRSRPVPGIRRALGFAVGFSLPLFTLTTGYIGTPTDLLSRIAGADILCLTFLAILLFRDRPLLPPWPAALFVFALFFSLVPALLSSQRSESLVWVSFVAILMAFMFYVLGLQLGSEPTLLRCVLAGLCTITFLESVIVFHDYFSASQWFPDPMEGRARGTFRANGQLGAFGFCASGLLITLGAPLAPSRLGRACLFAGILAATFVITASRRTGMLCVAAWTLLFPLFAYRSARRGYYKVFVGILLVALAIFAGYWSSFSQSFAGARLKEGLSRLSTEDGFIQAQLRNIFRTSGEWFPLGFGTGRGERIDPYDPEHHEVHNGLLAVLVEQGVLGFLGFVGLVGVPLWHCARRSPTDTESLRHALIASFLVCAMVFMFHNTLYRDRTFMLYLGLATSLLRREQPALFNVIHRPIRAPQLREDLV